MNENGCVPIKKIFFFTKAGSKLNLIHRLQFINSCSIAVPKKKLILLLFSFAVT